MQKPAIALIALCSYEDMGVLTLRTVLKSAGYDVDVVFFKEFRSNRQGYPTEKELKILVDLLKNRNRNIIGISIKSPHFPMAKDIISRIRENIPNAKIIMGGSHPTLCPEECIGHADMVCIGEGEGAMLDLAKNMQQGLSLEKIANLWVRQNNSIFKNEIRPLVENLDELPLPDLSKENIFYIDDEETKQNLEFSLYTTLTARGCPFSCAFCSTAALRKLYEKKGKYVRQRSVANVIEELKLVRDNLKKVNLIQFNDDVFGLNQEWVEKFCEIYSREIALPFQIVIHPQYVTEKLMKTLTDTKLLKLAQVGIQSGADRVAKDIFNRQTPKETILNAAKLFKKYKIHANYHLILDNPFATEKDNIETINFLLEFPRPFTLSLYSLTYFPKTVLTEKALADGIIKEENIEGRSDKCLSQIYISPDFKRSLAEAFYINLLYLTQIRFFPKFIIKIILKKGIFKKTPKILETINRCIDALDRFFYQVVPLALRGAKHLFSGNLDFNRLKSGMRSFEIIVKDKHNF